MAKDPAFLFYPGDFTTGTLHLDLECKGGYLMLLILQFQSNHMSLHMIKQVLGHKFEHIWPLISDKFKEKDGFYWNERLRIEKENRVKFCQSRRNNRNSKNAEGNHMSSHMEDEDLSSMILYSKSRRKKNEIALKGEKFDKSMGHVIFADRTYQPLGEQQKAELDRGKLKPNLVIQGSIY